MISLRVACESQSAQLAKRAAVCSRPPSEVGVGITAAVEMFWADVWVKGKKYMYICVVNRLGTLDVISKTRQSSD